MAKVKGQDIPAQEILYDPDPQRPFTLGQAYQSAMTEGHGGNVINGEMIVGRSPNSGHPPQRGPGSTEQQPQRDCFKCCGAMWRNTPTYYKNCVKELYNTPRPPPKTRQIPPEWYSTPYSTFMQKCLKKCREVGSCAFDPFDLINCPDPICQDTIILFTTQQMLINETQQLSIGNAHEGAVNNFQIGSGGGTITAGGLYTAPAANINCDENVTIELICEGRKIDSLEIALSGYANLCDVAYWKYEYLDGSYNPPDGFCCSAAYNCRGERVIVANCPFHFTTIYCTQTYPIYENHSDWPKSGGCGGTFANPYIDMRTQAMKNQGCCPTYLF